MKALENEGYSYLKHLSTGGQGTVHLIVKSGDIFVAKIFPRLSEEAFRLMEHISTLNIPNTPKIIKLINTDTETIIIREYISGNTLLEEIENKGPLSLDRAKAAILAICETLDAFHHVKPHPIIYRDLKPDNIIIAPDGKVFIIDFGIVRYYKQESIRDTVVIGTEGYTAPEIMAGMQSDARSDVYSTGLVFYEMITGKNLLKPPYQIRPVAESDKRLPSWLDILIEKATGMSAVTRFSTIEAFTQALNKPKTLYRKKRNQRLIIIAAGVLAVGFTAFGIYRYGYILKSESAAAEASETYQEILDLQFDDADDSDWLNLLGLDISLPETDANLDIHEMVSNGIYYMSYETRFRPSLEAGMLVHIRIKPGDLPGDGTVFILSLLPQIYTSGERAYNIHCNNHMNYASELRQSFGYYYSSAEGMAILVRDVWVDIVLWFSDSGEEIRYFIAELDNDQKLAYGGVRIPDEWLGYSYDLESDFFFDNYSEYGWSDVTIEMDFIRWASGSLSAYLNDFIPAYVNRRAETEQFLETPLSLIPKDDYTPHGY